jgi:hypothetical protein
MELNYEEDEAAAALDYYQIRDSDLDDCLGSLEDKAIHVASASNGNRKVSADQWIDKKARLGLQKDGEPEREGQMDPELDSLLREGEGEEEGGLLSNLVTGKESNKRKIPPNLYQKGDNKQLYREGKALVMPLTKIECKRLREPC